MGSFACTRCGDCCRWRGAVKVTDDEVDAIAAFLNMPVTEFLERHTVFTPDRRHLSLCDKENGECEFLTVGSDGLAACAIQSVKPRQCRDFPLKWNFHGWEEKCPGGGKLS